MMSAEPWASMVPVIIANPMSDFLSAGASFVPSPVTATTSFNCCNPVTRVNLSSGLDLARIFKSFTTFLNSSMFSTVWTKSLPDSVWSVSRDIVLTCFLGYLTTLPTLYLNWEPVIHLTLLADSSSSSLVWRIPEWIPMALAVSRLSPVHIITLIPDV